MQKFYRLIQILMLWPALASAGSFSNGAIDSTARANAATAQSTANNATVVYTTTTTPLLGTGGIYSVANPLGVMPAWVNFEVICVNAEAGYSAGDVVQVNLQGSGSTNVPLQIVKTASTLMIPEAGANNIELANKSTGVLFTPTAANWSYRFALRRN